MPKIEVDADEFEQFNAEYKALVLRLDQTRKDADAYISKLGEEHQARIAAERRLGSWRDLVWAMSEWHSRMAYSDPDAHEKRWDELIEKAVYLDEPVVEKHSYLPGELADIAKIPHEDE